MTPPSSQIESRQFRTTPAKRGRKSYTTPDVIDVTGRTHFMVVRRVQNKKAKKKINNFECKNCELNDEYVDVLEERVDTLEKLVDNLNNKVTNIGTLTKNSVANSNELNSYSHLDMNSLLRLSDTLGQVLCNDISNNNNIQQVSPTTTIETEFVNENIMPGLWDMTNMAGQNIF